MAEPRTETILYDADGNRTDDESVAVRGERSWRLTKPDESWARHPDLDWEVDPISLEGDEGELATRPRHDES